MKKKIINFLMPRYYDDMPQQQVTGSFQAGSVMLTPEFGYERYEYYLSKVFTDNLAAYRCARWHALLRDLMTRVTMPTYGVDWIVKDLSVV